jgi:LPXTG-motif cell wall-anchored protein
MTPMRVVWTIVMWLVIWPDEPKEFTLRLAFLMVLVLIGLVIADIVQYSFRWGEIVTIAAFIVGTSAAGIGLGLWLSRRKRRKRA